MAILKLSPICLPNLLSKADNRWTGTNNFVLEYWQYKKYYKTCSWLIQLYLQNDARSDKPMNVKWNRPKISYLKYFIIFHRLCTKHKSMAEPLWPFSSHLSVCKTDVLPTTRVESTFFFILKTVQAMLKNKGKHSLTQTVRVFPFWGSPREGGPLFPFKIALCS